MTIFTLIISIVALVFSAVMLFLNIKRYYQLKKQIDILNRWIGWYETINRLKMED